MFTSLVRVSSSNTNEQLLNEPEKNAENEEITKVEVKERQKRKRELTSAVWKAKNVREIESEVNNITVITVLYLGYCEKRDVSFFTVLLYHILNLLQLRQLLINKLITLQFIFFTHDKRRNFHEKSASPITSFTVHTILSHSRHLPQTLSDKKSRVF